MRKICARAAALCVGLLTVGVAAAGCGKSPTSPTPELTTETFTGTLSPGGLAFHTFTVNYAQAYSDASVTVAKLTAVSDGSERAITVGVGFGVISVGTCTRVASLTNQTAAYNTELPTNGNPFLAGSYCIAIFDNPDARTVTESLAYTLVVKHY